MQLTGRQQWISAATIGLLGYIVWGIGFYTMPVFYVPLEKEFGWTRTELTSIGAITIFLYSISGPAIGALVDTVGVHKVVIAGVVLFGVSFAFFAAGISTLRGIYLIGCA